jgi:phage baseplate assembly protein W
MRPEFGCRIHEHVFDAVDAYALGRFDYEIRVALDRFEPRIDVVDIAFDTTRIDDGLLEIDIAYRLRTSSDVRNLVFPFYVIPAGEEAE